MTVSTRNVYTPATTGTMLEQREKYAAEKYESLSYRDRQDIDRLCVVLHDHFKAKGFKPEPSIRFKLDLLMVFGTFMNEQERMK